LDDLRGFPREVRRDLGQALFEAQIGGKHPAAKPLSGFGGAGVLEIVADYEGNAYRGIYTVKLGSAIYVLHTFQKKSKRGDQDAKTRSRSDRSAAEGGRSALPSHILTEALTGSLRMVHTVTRGSGNVFADLGLENPDEELLKAQLAVRIRAVISEQGLTQAKAAKVLKVAQPDVSALVNGRISGFSLERLFSFVRRLGDDVEVTIKHAKPARATGRMLLRVA
jgi:phage-related protein/predicted XRE-type DNA-binding protein